MLFNLRAWQSLTETQKEQKIFCCHFNFDKQDDSAAAYAMLAQNCVVQPSHKQQIYNIAENLMK